MASRIHKSEAQSIAESRTATYADEHAASWSVRFERVEPKALTGLVIELRRAYRDEIPDRLHTHAVDDGGTPAYSGEFAALLYGSPHAVDRHDPAGDFAAEVYLTPVRHALAAMLRAREGATVQMGRIAAHVILGGDQPEAAVGREVGAIEPWIARAAAERALRVFWRRCSDIRLDLGKSVSAA